MPPLRINPALLGAGTPPAGCRVADAGILGGIATQVAPPMAKAPLPLLRLLPRQLLPFPRRLPLQ
jgi:hypothetical protein